MRKRHWPDRKNRKCPDCNRLIYYTRKDTFDVAVGNNSVCKSCAQMDRKLSMETIEKMKKPKSTQHKLNISKTMVDVWKKRKLEQIKESEKWQSSRVNS
jgi:5-methylcytosine-specific restriction endonuclease McrA